MENGFSYPEYMYLDFLKKKRYAYKCSICGRVGEGYWKKRVKGNITCGYCRSELAKIKYREQQKEKWRCAIVEN